ncbi:hypothetical protein HPB52_000400 [Rhipicephalus sanguineus]|uniref:Tick transposon n=1 Tax=Rhipicephalus sanguineus TaxID=34632 RepID=A0A9D4PKY5_RHISA|nr:hypothetical protein HPB52_000400 [Rhipicephalus sanguineus]
MVDTCQRCGRARATQNHILWECLPPPPNTQNGQIPEEIDKEITSEEYETQRDIVRHVLELLDLQTPGTTDRSQERQLGESRTSATNMQQKTRASLPTETRSST